MCLPCTSHYAYTAPLTVPTQHLSLCLLITSHCTSPAPPIVPTKHIPLCLPSIVLRRSYAVDNTLKSKNQLTNLPSTCHCAYPAHPTVPTQHIPLCQPSTSHCTYPNSWTSAEATEAPSTWTTPLVMLTERGLVKVIVPSYSVPVFMSSGTCSRKGRGGAGRLVIKILTG